MEFPNISFKNHAHVTRFNKKVERGNIGFVKLLDGIIQYTLDMKSAYAILSITEILLADRRINLPGTIGSPNWEYKVRDFRGLSRRLKLISKMIRKARRK